MRQRKNILTSVRIESTTSGIDLPLLCRLSYKVAQRKSGTILDAESRRRESKGTYGMLCRVPLGTQIVEQGTTRGKEKYILTSVGIEPTTSGIDLPLLCRLSYKVAQRKSKEVKRYFLCLVWFPVSLY